MSTGFDLTIALPSGSLEAYLQSLNRIPLLSAEEERRLAERYRKFNDIEAARRMVVSHLKFVVKIARGYYGYGLAQADLIQEGSIGLMKAVKRFDPNLGVRLVSFAIHWIRAEIHEFILRNWRIVKVATTKAQRKLFFKLRSAKKSLRWLRKSEVEEIARNFDVSEGAVVEMEQRLNSRDTSFDPYAETDDEGNGVFAPQNLLPDLRFEPFTTLANEESQTKAVDQLRESLLSLDVRSQTIIRKRWLSPEKATLQELAQQFGVSAERIRQLEQNALEKLRSEFRIIEISACA